MARKITVTFADGSQVQYQNAPDDVTPQEVVDRATREYRKPVKAVDGGRGTIERAARAVGGVVSSAVDLVTPEKQAPLDRSGARGLGLADMGNTGRSLGLPAPVAKAANERGQAVAARINAPATIETDGYLDRQGVKIKQTMAGIGSGIVRAVAADTRDATSILPESFGDYLTQRADNADRYINAQVKGGTEFDDIMKADGVLGKVGAAVSFMAEEIPAALAYTPLLMTGLGTGAVVTSQAGNIGQDRADNNRTGPASSMDIMAAAPAALASTALDKFGFDRMLGGVGKTAATRIATAAGTEALTEGVQGVIEYAGGTVGTEKGFDANEAARQAAAGALVGFGAGGAFRGVGEAIDATGRISARRADDTRTPGPGIVESATANAATLTPEDLASPLGNVDLAEGMAEIVKPEATGQADAALSQAGLPKVGSQVNVTGLPGGSAMSGTIEDVFTDDTGTGVVVRPEGGGKPMREYLDTLNELGVSITAFDPLAETDSIDATLAALSSATAEEPPLASADVETPSPRPSGRTPSTGAGGGVNRTIVEGLMKRGFKEGQALGIAAGIHAESASNANAKNPTSGAMGLGQWLGPRKAAIRKQFGDNPTLDQQLDFLASELRGGDKGGKYVLSQNDPAKVLDAYIRKFMRPAAGAETDGDLARGMAALGLGVTEGDTGATVPDAPMQWAELPDAAPIRSSEAPAPDLPVQPVEASDEQFDYKVRGVATSIFGDTFGGKKAREFAVNSNDPAFPDALEAAGIKPVDFSEAGVHFKESDREAVDQVIADRRANPGAWREIRARASQSNTAGPQDGGVAPTVEAPKAGGPEATADDSAGSAAGAVTSPQPVSNPQQLAGSINPDTQATTAATQSLAGASSGGGFPTSTGAPAKAPIPARAEARQDVAVTATGSEIPVNYAVVELGDLVASNTSDGGVNPAYPADRQPRDRTRAASQTQIAEIASRLNPRLLGRSPKASDGSPIISPDGIVESGNGRTLALQRVYGENGENAQAYRQFVESEGFDTAGMQQPVLVRIRDGNLSTEQVQDFVRAANVRDTAGMSGTETAGSDAAAMPAQMVDMYRGGDIEAAGNRDFVKAFVNALVPTNERASMILADGSIAKPLVARMEAALLVRAFGQRPFIEKMVDATDSNIRAIGKALVEMAGKFAKLREAAQDGRVDPDMDITGNIAEAVEIIDRARREGKPIGDYVNQRDIFSGTTVAQMTESALRMFFARPDFTKPHGQAKLVAAMDFYVEEAMKAAPGGGLFGESTKATPDGIIQLANERNTRTEPAGTDLFSAPRQSGDGANVTSVPDAGGERGLVGEGVQALTREESGSSSEPVEPEAVDTPADPVVSEAPAVDVPAETVDGQPADTPTRIDDFGEQLVGARKDVWQSYKDRLKDAAEIDVTAEPLSKTWPEPDYQKLLDAGADPYVVAWVHAARDEIPTKPQKGWKLKGWADDVRLLRDMANKLLNGDMDADTVKERMLSPAFRNSLRDLQGRVDLYMEVGHEKSLKGITLASHFYSLYRGEKNVSKWSVEKKAKATAFGNWPREIAVGDTREEAVAKFKALYAAGGLEKKADAIVRFDIYSRRSEPGFIIGKKVGKDYVDLKRFDTAKEARDFKVSDAGYAELVAALDGFKDIPAERKASNAPRIGIDHRSGADVTPEAFAEAFGFRGVQFGNYVEGDRRQSDLNEAYDALMDLAGVIGVPARALSLNGELGLAFGARGKGGKGAAAAHFEPDTIVINLTKNKGAGSLAHEWWHSLDNYFSRMRAGGGYMTEGKIASTEGVRPEMVQAFKAVVSAIKQTGLQQRSKNLDKRRTKDYWSTDIEMSARAFESFVIAKLQDEQFSNDYLANIVGEAAFAIEDGYPYLRAAEIPAVRAAFDEFFNTVEVKETERGVALYSVPEANDLPTVTVSESDWGKLPKPGRARLEILRARVGRWYDSLIGTTVTAADGREVKFNRTGEKKTLRAGEDLLMIAKAIPKIIQRGKLVGSEPSNRPGMRAVHRYAANVRGADGNTQGVMVFVRETGDGSFQYSLNHVVENARDTSAEADREAKKAFAPALEGGARDSLNLVPLDVSDKSVSSTDMAQLESNLQERLESYGIARKVAVRIVDTLGGAAGEYQNALMKIATDTTQAEAFTLDHEVVHALRELGLFNTSEWAILSAKARRETGLMRSIKQRYEAGFRQRGMSGAALDEALIEEAVADMFARYQRGDYKADGTIARVFKALRQALEAIANFVQQRGARTAEGVMGDVASGAVGGREIGEVRGGDTKQMVVWHGSPHEFDRFTLGAVGTGEGAQAYGWGLYFAGRKEVAEHYRRALAIKPLLDKIEIDQDIFAGEAVAIAREEGRLTEKEAELLDALEADDFLGFDYLHQAIRAAFREPENFELSPELVDAIKSQGRLYQVDIPEDNEFLLWDKLLSEQPEKVKAAVGDTFEALGFDRDGVTMATRRGDIEGFEVTGNEFYDWFSREANRNGGEPDGRGSSRSDRAASLALMEAGIAGIKYLDGTSRKVGDGTFNYVLFDDTRAQVMAKLSIPEYPNAESKNAIPTPLGRVQDFASDEQRVSAVRTMLSGIGQGDGSRLQDLSDEWRIRIQDKMLPILRVQERVEQTLGKEIAESENPYLQEELMTGRAGARLERLSEEIVSPLLAAMHEHDVSLDELETFLYARHAPERNARIAEINPEFSEGEGSGMTDLESAAVMSRVAKSGKKAEIEALASMVDKMLADALQTRIDAGLISKEEAAAWAETYKHYVPLRGRIEVDGDVEVARARVQAGLTVKGKESKRAFGRRSKADSILSYAILQAEEAIIRAEKNTAAQAFLKLAQANPDEGFWKVNKIERRPVFNEASGLVRYENQSRISADDAPFTVTAKVDGVEHHITMERTNPEAVRVATAMRNLDDAKFNKVMAAAANFNRYYSAINTRFNPGFVPANMIRDIETAMITLAASDIPGLRQAVMRDYLKAMTASSDPQSEWGRWRREWEMAGGKIYYNQTGDLNTIRKDIDLRLKMKGRGANQAAKIWSGAFDGIEAANEAVERALRLSVYKNARESGLSPAKAASLSRNATTNFTRKGKWGPQINAGFAFFNASVQGAATLLRALAKSKKARRFVYGVMAASFLSEMLNGMLSGTDDDGEKFWDKLPDHEKDKFFIIMMPGGDMGTAIKIPVAYGLNSFANAARNLASVMRGTKTVGQASLSSAISMMDSFNPLGSGSLINMVMPTIADPFVDVYLTNKNFAGRPIVPAGNPFGTERTPSSNPARSATEVSKAIAKSVNKLTGGDDVLPGYLSMYPERMDYFFGFVTGGAGRFVRDLIVDLPMKAYAGEDISVRDVPIAKVFVTEKPDWVDKARFYERVKQVKEFEDHAKEYLEREDQAGFDRHVAANKSLAGMYDITKAADKRMREIRKERNETLFAVEMNKITSEGARPILKEIEADEAFAISKYNEIWNATMASKGAGGDEDE